MEELSQAQLQEVLATEEGLILTFYRFTQNPRLAYLVFDLDISFPFVGLYFQNPWPQLKKVKPVGLFLNSHAKNLTVCDMQLLENFGRVLDLRLGSGELQTKIEFRMIPKNANLIVTQGKKSISWYAKKELSEQILPFADSDKIEAEARSIPFILDLWLQRRGVFKNKSLDDKAMDSNPYEKWKAQRSKNLLKKKKALDGIRQQIHNFLYFPWIEIGEHLKTYGFKDIKAEWSPYLNFELKVSQNIQNCFIKAKAAQLKIKGAEARLTILEKEILELQDFSEAAFQNFLIKNNQRQMQNKKKSRSVEGRYRKLVLENEKDNQILTCYMGKSAKDNSDLLRKAKAWDYWVHLKDYPSAYAIIHRQKSQSVSSSEIRKVSEWLVKESFKEKKSTVGLKFAVVYVECRHVRPIKGDKLGRVTYHEAREILIAL